MCLNITPARRCEKADREADEDDLHESGEAAIVARTRVLSRYLIELFDRLMLDLSEEGARAVATARLVAGKDDQAREGRTDRDPTVRRMSRISWRSERLPQ